MKILCVKIYNILCNVGNDVVSPYHHNFIPIVRASVIVLERVFLFFVSIFVCFIVLLIKKFAKVFAIK